MSRPPQPPAGASHVLTEPPGDASRSASGERTRSIVELAVALTPDLPAQELAEVADLTEDKKRRILALHLRLDELGYYDLLGVDPTATKKDIKRGYYAVAPEFHPDRFFRKSLGSYKAKIEAIFTRMTLALDVLTDNEKRRHYDEYLSVTQQNRAIVAALGDGESAVAAAVSRARSEAEAAARKLAETPAPDPVQLRPQSAEERRAALLRKLGRSPSSSELPRATAPVVAAPAPRERIEVLRQRYEMVRREVLGRQVSDHVRQGEASLRDGNFLGAVNAYRIAVQLAPDDPALAARSAEVGKRAASALAEGMRKQADYEASTERWTEAALSYTKVCEGRPDDARAHERAAFALIKVGGNAKKAVALARRAVELSPGQVEYRITLARAFQSAGFEASATAELQRALESAPGDARVRELVTRARDSIAPKAS